MSTMLLIELLALGLAIWAAWLSIPRPPALDWERLFKTCLATVVRGEVEAEKGSATDWEARLKQEVPYHPAARDLERWLAQPDPDEIRTPALDGERALVTALSLLTDAGSRYRYAMCGEARGLDALMGDPAWLGKDYDPASVLGPDCSWDAIAAWSPPIVEGLMRRLAHVVFVGVGEVDWRALCPIPGLRVVAVAELDSESIYASVESALEQSSDRVIFGLGKGSSDVVLGLMKDNAAVRDRVVGVVAMGIDLHTDWVREHFTQKTMEPELQRTLPFFSLVDVNSDDPLSRAWASQRFPDPPVTEGGRRSIEAIDLGPVPLSQLSDGLLGRALWTTLCFRIHQGG
jgi:hypothetical protein